MNGGFAYYEAGHAVVGHVLGFVVESASIIESGGVGGEVAFAENPPDPGADERCYLDYRERELVFTLGGPWPKGCTWKGTPLPQPNSLGSMPHGMPLLRTKTMPVSAIRSGTWGLPPLGLGG
jgi:hypothetical protein